MFILLYASHLSFLVVDAQNSFLIVCGTITYHQTDLLSKDMAAFGISLARLVGLMGTSFIAMRRKAREATAFQNSCRTIIGKFCIFFKISFAFFVSCAKFSILTQQNWVDKESSKGFGSLRERSEACTPPKIRFAFDGTEHRRGRGKTGAAWLRRRISPPILSGKNRSPDRIQAICS